MVSELHGAYLQLKVIPKSESATVISFRERQKQGPGKREVLQKEKGSQLARRFLR